MPDFKKATHLYELPFEGSWTTAVAFIGPSKLAAGNREGELFVWDLSVELPPDEDKKKDEPAAGPPPVRKLAGHTNGITHLLAADGGKTLISASLDHSVRLWDTTAATKEKVEAVLDIKSREAEAKRARNDEALKRPGVEVELQSASELLAGHSDWVKGLGLSADGKRLISGDDACLSIVWDLSTRKEVSRWNGYPRNWVSSAALSPDGQTAFVAEYCSSRGSFDRPPAQARFYSVADGSQMIDVLKVQFPDVKVRDNSYGYSRTWRKFVGRGFVAAAYSPDGKLVAVGQGGETDTGEVHLLEAATGKLVRSVASHRYGATHVQFSPDGGHVISTGRDTTVQVCQVKDGKEVARIGKPRGGQFKDWLHAAAISPDEKYLAAADIAGKVQVWSL